MSVEREYIKQLMNEIEHLETEKEEIKQLIEENTELKKIINQYESDISLLEKENRNIKETVRSPVITNPDTFDIFNSIKNGNIINFIKPTINKKYKKYPKNPFTFQMDNKCAVFEGKLIGMWEQKTGNIRYYYVNKGSSFLNSEILKMLNVTEETKDCSVKKLACKKPKRSEYMSAGEILHLNPVINISTGKFVSDKNKFIYTKKDGSKYIIKQNGKEEVY